jgi:hypothetical protein
VPEPAACAFCPCPTVTVVNRDGEAYVRCNRCRARGPVAEEGETPGVVAAVAAWNRRVTVGATGAYGESGRWYNTGFRDALSIAISEVRQEGIPVCMRAADRLRRTRDGRAGASPPAEHEETP